MIDNDYPSLACSPDGLVDIPGEEGGVVEIKCPYVAVKEGLDPVSAAATLKTFFAKRWRCRESQAQWLRIPSSQ